MLFKKQRLLFKAELERVVASDCVRIRVVGLHEFWVVDEKVGKGTHFNWVTERVFVKREGVKEFLRLTAAVQKVVDSTVGRSCSYHIAIE